MCRRSTSICRSRTRSRRSRSRCSTQNCAEFGVRLHPMGDPGQGIVHVIGPELGLTLAGHDDRLRRQPHVDARRVRRARVRHRHQRSRARARHADAAADHAEDDGDHASTANLPEADRQGRHPRDHRQDRHRRRHRLNRRIPRIGHSRALDGRPDDDLQHVDRSRRQGRHDRAGRHHLRLRRRTQARAKGSALGTGARRLAIAADRRRRRRSTREVDARWRARSRRTSPGAPIRARWSPIDGRGARSGCSSPIPAREKPRRALCSYMDLVPGTPMRDIPVDTVFIGSCTNSRIEDLRLGGVGRRRAQRSPRHAGDGRAGFDAGQGAGRSRRSRPDLHDGRIRVAIGRLLDVPRHEPGPSSTPGERCASTSNRNFEGRQGKGGRTHLVSPAVAAATAIAGTSRRRRILRVER